jgi:hypothetical protein
MSGSDHRKPGIGQPWHPCVADKHDHASGGMPKNLFGDVSFVVFVQCHDRGVRGCPEKPHELARGPGVFSHNQVGILKRSDKPGRVIVEVTDWGGGDQKHPDIVPAAWALT